MVAKHEELTYVMYTPVSVVVLGVTAGGMGDNVLGEALGGRFVLTGLVPGFGLSSAPVTIIASRFSYIWFPF